MNYRQSRLFTDNTPRRVADHDLIAAFVRTANICHRQFGGCGPCNLAVVKQPLISQRLAPRSLDTKHRCLTADGARRLRLQGDDDRLIYGDLRVLTGRFTGGVFDHHTVCAGIRRDGTVDLKNRLVALQHRFPVPVPMIRQRLAAPGSHAQDKLIPLAPRVRVRLSQNDRWNNHFESGALAPNCAHDVGDIHLIDTSVIVLDTENTKL